MVIFISITEHHNILTKTFSLIKEKFMKADYPLHFTGSVVNEFLKGKECED